MISTEPIWLPPPAKPLLARDEIHVWRAALDSQDQPLSALERTLAPDELNRAARFHFQRDRRRFVVGRGVLRMILSRYLDLAPEQISFAYTAYGKPALAPPADQARLSFNVSHSGELALYAITRERAIGVDIEHMRDNVEHEQIAARFFAPVEHTRLCALPAEMRSAAFYACWTRKEAYIKAHGKGLSLPLDGFIVSLAPGEPAALLQTLEDPNEASHWSLQELFPGPGYTAALAVEGHGWRLACWQWQDRL